METNPHAWMGDLQLAVLLECNVVHPRAHPPMDETKLLECVGCKHLVLVVEISVLPTTSTYKLVGTKW